MIPAAHLPLKQEERMIFRSPHPDVSIPAQSLTDFVLGSPGGAPLSLELAEAVQQRLKTPIKQGYGMTEASPATHWADFRSEFRSSTAGVSYHRPNVESSMSTRDATWAPASRVKCGCAGPR